MCHPKCLRLCFYFIILRTFVQPGDLLISMEEKEEKKASQKHEGIGRTKSSPTGCPSTASLISAYRRHAATPHEVVGKCL